MIHDKRNGTGHSSEKLLIKTWIVALLLSPFGRIRAFSIISTKRMGPDRTQPSTSFRTFLQTEVRSFKCTVRQVLKEPSTSADNRVRMSLNGKEDSEIKDRQSKQDASLLQSMQLEAIRNSDFIRSSIVNNHEKQRRVRAATRKKYSRKKIPDSEKEIKRIHKQRQEQYERMTKNSDGTVSLWSFESLFPDPVWDEQSIYKDLYEIRDRDKKREADRKGSLLPSTATASPVGSAIKTNLNGSSNNNNRNQYNSFPHSKMKSSWYGGNAMMRLWREPRLRSGLPSFSMKPLIGDNLLEETSRPTLGLNSPLLLTGMMKTEISSVMLRNNTKPRLKVDSDLTRMVEDRVYGYRRLQTGELRYETSLLSDGAVSFRDGVRLGNPLRINADRLNYLAKKEMQHGRVEEASELYEEAISIDPRDGRAYLGLSRCADRRRDFKLARKWLQLGITNSVSLAGDEPDRGANPFLLQALGCLEEKMGNLAAAESLYVLAAKSRPSHAAAWVALAQIRTRKLGQPASAGRVCFQTAERELASAGLQPSSFIYTAWASLERKAGDIRQARKLFKKAIDVDPKCSAAWLQLGVLEADAGNWDEAETCFSTVLKFDQRNSRVLQAYALAESKKPKGCSRKAIELFERALKVNPRDAGVLQAYALYVLELGDVKSARNLLRRGTEVNKRHAAVWQAWGVLETRQGNTTEARRIFQEGIWACGQMTGSQSGGYNCARLWQAWGVLEIQCEDYPAARRCFNRALDANSRNVPAVTAWALMEEKLGNENDARMIFEQALRNFAAGSNDKMALWRNYELMEQRLGDVEAAKIVYQRAIRESININDNDKNPIEGTPGGSKQKAAIPELVDALNDMNRTKKAKNEFEVVRWDSPNGEVWLNDKAIESKMKIKNRFNKQ